MISPTAYVARAALWNLMEQTQGNNVIDDGVWDAIYEELGSSASDEEVRKRAIAFLDSIVNLLIGLGIPKDDTELAELVKDGNREISERLES